ncbi:hypothetical protein AM629_21680, partial [Photorhabdus heterorhabditis]
MSLNTFCIGLYGGEGTSTVLSSVTTGAEAGAHPQDKYGCSTSLEFGALGWFSPDEMSDKARNHFNPEAKCTLELTAMRGKNSQILTAIEVAIDENDQPVATKSKDETKYATISTPVIR